MSVVDPRLIDSIYAAAETPSLWQDFVDRLSEAVGDNAVALSTSFQAKGAEPQLFLAGLHRDPPGVTTMGPFEGGSLWGTVDPGSAEGFVRWRIDRDGVRTNAALAAWCEDQGLVTEAPLVHRIAGRGDAPQATIVLFRRTGHRAFTDEDVSLCDGLVPHLRQAYEIQAAVQDGERDRLAFSGVIDRIPLGVLLLDANRRPVFCNTTGREILAQRDGFRLQDGRLTLASPDEDATFAEKFSTAAPQGAEVGATLGVSRPSGRRSYAVSLQSLRRPAVAGRRSAADDAVVSLLVTDPDATPIDEAGVLQRLYDVTPAEEELIRLLVDGASIEQAATLRGVSVHTVRSQLKAIYSKTGVHRLGELMHLVLSGVGKLRGP